jgi:hypothetical protein
LPGMPLPVLGNGSCAPGFLNRHLAFIYLHFGNRVDGL